MPFLTDKISMKTKKDKKGARVLRGVRLAGSWDVKGKWGFIKNGCDHELQWFMQNYKYTNEVKTKYELRVNEHHQ